MNMFWNNKETAVSCEKDGGVFAHVFRAASIAAIACSYISPATSDELPPPVISINPDAEATTAIETTAAIETTTGIETTTVTEDAEVTEVKRTQEFLANLLEFLRAQEDPDAQDAEKVLIMSIAFKAGTKENLIAFRFGESSVVTDDLMGLTIPDVKPEPDFKAIVIYTNSPANVQSCGNSGGTPICKKL